MKGSTGFGLLHCSHGPGTEVDAVAGQTIAAKAKKTNPIDLYISVVEVVFVAWPWAQITGDQYSVAKGRCR